MKSKLASLVIRSLSKKQVKVMTWWLPSSKYSEHNGIVADGAIRSGKTLIMSLSFCIWAMDTFNGCLFGMAGKSVGSFRRNVVLWLKLLLKSQGYIVIDKKTENVLEIHKGGKVNYFYIFGGRDERSQDFVQGMTAAGFFFDEVTLMPESFVNQATARCSVEGSKWWFNCNPDKPTHWFKVGWIDEKIKKGLYHLHFNLDDNPSLSEKIKERYRSMFVGVFYLRYILGLWVLAEGVIYDMFDEGKNLYSSEELTAEMKFKALRYVVIDYGTINPMVFLDIYDTGGVSYLDREYYYDSVKAGKQKTNKEYIEDLKEFIAGETIPINVERIIIDPSAASFKVEIRNAGLIPKDANNDVLEGIRLTGSAFQQGLLKINKQCKNAREEIGSYSWDSKAKDRGVEQPMKMNDHACVTGDTLIETISGKKRIKDLVGTKGWVYCIDSKSRRRVIRQFKNVCMTGENRDIYKVTMSNGKTIKATEDHPVLTKKGWKRIDELVVGSNVVRINYVNRGNAEEKEATSICRRCGKEIIMKKNDVDAKEKEEGFCDIFCSNDYILGYSLVDVESIELIGKEDVYNMQVRDTKNYSIDGGFILHNCDCLRYYCNSVLKRRIMGR